MGTNEAQTVSVVKLRFAERAEAVERTFERSAVFRGLCREYSLCAAALARWQVSDAPEAGLRSAEYAELLAELAREIEACLRTDSR